MFVWVEQLKNRFKDAKDRFKQTIHFDDWAPKLLKLFKVISICFAVIGLIVLVASLALS